MNGITLKENQSLFFQAEDKDGHILATNSISIFKIGKMSPEDFKVDLKTEGKGFLPFSASLTSNGMIYNDIYFKYTLTEDVRLTKNGSLSSDISSEYIDFNEIDSGHTYVLHNDSFSAKQVTLYFEVRNKVTNAVMITKSYTVTINVVSESQINSGTVDGEDDPSVVTGGNSLFGSYSDSDGFNLNMSFDDIMNTAKGSFNTFKMIFSILPSFIWILVALGISISIILRIVGR